MSGQVLSLNPHSSTVAADLRKLADNIDAGKHPGTAAIVVMHDRVGGTMYRTFCGDMMPYSHWLGLLSYASHMVYAECQRDG